MNLNQVINKTSFTEAINFTLVTGTRAEASERVAAYMIRIGAVLLFIVFMSIIVSYLHDKLFLEPKMVNITHKRLKKK
jgi:hypothetical protein